METFNIIVGLAVIAGTAFAGMTWWYAFQDFNARRPQTHPQGAPKPMASSKWQLQSLALFGAVVLVSTWALLAAQLGWIGASKFDPNVKLETVFEHNYKNQTVIMDGFEFIECKFENVTLIYKGTAPFRVTNSNFSGLGEIGFGSIDPSVNLAIGLMVRLQAAYDQIHLRVMPLDETQKQFSTRQ